MELRIVSTREGARRSVNGRRFGFAVVFSLLLCGIAGMPQGCSASDWGFAWEIGAITATPKGNPFVFRLTTAKSYSKEFSLGPSFFLTPYGDNKMYSGSLNAMFHFSLREDLLVSPFLGVGAVRRETANDNDGALVFPMGASLEKRAGERLYLVGTISFNLHGGIELEGEEDGASIGLTAGISYSP